MPRCEVIVNVNGEDYKRLVNVTAAERDEMQTSLDALVEVAEESGDEVTVSVEWFETLTEANVAAILLWAADCMEVPIEEVKD